MLYRVTFPPCPCSNEVPTLAPTANIYFQLQVLAYLGAIDLEVLVPLFRAQQVQGGWLA